MTDKERILAEIDKLKRCTMDEHMKFYCESAEAEYNALSRVELFINSLQEKPVSEDLEEAAIEYCGGNKGSDARVRTGFIMGAKWQKEWDSKKKELKKIEDESENYKQQVMDETTDSVKDCISQEFAEWSEEDENILEAYSRYR